MNILGFYCKQWKLLFYSLQRAYVFFVLEKATSKEDLQNFREE